MNGFIIGLLGFTADFIFATVFGASLTSCDEFPDPSLSKWVYLMTLGVTGLCFGM
jgi:hypothetical protein